MSPLPRHHVTVTPTPCRGNPDTMSPDSINDPSIEPSNDPANSFVLGAVEPDDPTPVAKPKRSKSKSRALTTDEERDFDSFWEAYPLKVDKDDARKAFRGALDRASAGAIVLGAQRYAAEVTENGTEKRYIRHPPRWLNAGSWENEPIRAGPSRPKSTGGSTLFDAMSNLANSLFDAEEAPEPAWPTI